MTQDDRRPEVPLIRTLFLWGARWTAGLGLIGIATYGRTDLSWTWAVGVLFALGDLLYTLLKEARLADKRAEARVRLNELQSRLGDEDIAEDK